jgi:hypothetical protein
MDLEPNVTPEEQQEYELFVSKGQELIYGDSFDSILERLRADEDPVQALANTIVQVVRRLVVSSRDAGKDFAGDLVYQGGSELIEDLANTMDAAGIHTFTEQELEKTLYVALDLYRDIEIEEGELDQEGAQQDWGGLQQANASGSLDNVMNALREQSGGYKYAGDVVSEQPEPDKGIRGLGR